MAKALTTRINELKRKLAKAENDLAVIRQNDIQPPSKGQYGNIWWVKEKGRKTRILYWKALLCDLLLERVAELEAQRSRQGDDE